MTFLGITWVSLKDFTQLPFGSFFTYAVLFPNTFKQTVMNKITAVLLEMNKCRILWYPEIFTECGWRFLKKSMGFCWKNLDSVFFLILATALYLQYRVPYTVAFMSSHYIGGGWCHILSSLCAAPRGPAVSGTQGRLCLMHNGMRDEMTKKRGVFELATVPLCLGQLLKKESVQQQGLEGKTHWWNKLLLSQQSCHFQLKC